MRDGDPKYHALSKYYDDFPERAHQFLSYGKSFAALAGELDVSIESIERWRKEKPEFNDACNRGRAKGQAWWEEQGDSNMENRNYSATMYIFKMKSQYKVKDGSEPIKQDPISTHMLFGMEGSEHKSLVERVLGDAQQRGE